MGDLTEWSAGAVVFDVDANTNIFERVPAEALVICRSIIPHSLE